MACSAISYTLERLSFICSWSISCRANTASITGDCSHSLEFIPPVSVFVCQLISHLEWAKMRGMIWDPVLRFFYQMLRVGGIKKRWVYMLQKIRKAFAWATVHKGGRPRRLCRFITPTEELKIIFWFNHQSTELLYGKPLILMFYWGSWRPWALFTNSKSITSFHHLEISWIVPYF